ncbi:MAG: exodeoxyribonuclease VII small subunit [Candidatus Hydrogenedentes bacterium]|nr:exodeoxyribonuclease VII small subunit [Candidatus Hydrogenedentota bacterium]
MSSKKNSTSKESSFEDDLQRLEEIVNDLESGKLPLDSALQQFESGVKLVRKCEQTLSAAEKKIEMLVQGMDNNLEAVPFNESGDAEETATAEKPSPDTAKHQPKEPKSKQAPPSAAEYSDATEDDADDEDELY